MKKYIGFQNASSSLIKQIVVVASALQDTRSAKLRVGRWKEKKRNVSTRNSKGKRNIYAEKRHVTLGEADDLMSK